MQRPWVVERQVDMQTGSDLGFDPNEVAEAGADAARIVARIGGVVYIGADREEIGSLDADGKQPLYETQRLLFRWDSFVPARRQRREAAKQEEDLPPVEEPLAGEPVSVAADGHGEAQEE